MPYFLEIYMKKLSVIPIVVAAILWGALGLFTTSLRDAGLSTMQVVSTRAIFATLTLATVNLISGGIKSFKVKLYDLAILFACGTITLTINNYFYFQSIERIGMSSAAVLQYTAPAFVLIMSALVFGESITAKKIASIIITILGCALVSLSTEGNKMDMLGVLFGILSGFTYATYSIFTKGLLKKYSAVTIVMYTYMSAAISSFFAANPVEIVSVLINKNLIITGLIMGVFCSAAAHGLYSLGLKHTEPSIASIVASLELVAASLFGFIFYRQEILWYQCIGIFVVIFAIVLSNIKLKSKQPT